jgi:nucleoside-diphosphate-sugar epimerase
LAGEQLVEVYRREYDVPVVSLRYFTVFGPRQRPDMAFQRFIGAALAGEALTLLGDGNQSRDFTFVDDVVSATIAALGAPSPVYNVGGGSPATINDVLDVIAELTAQRLVVQRGPVARGDVSHTWADTTLAREELDWAPKTDLYPGLAVQIDHCVRLASGRRLPQVAHREQGGP